MTTKSLTKILSKELGPISFGGFLRAARTAKDKTQKEMAEFLGIAKGTLCDIEKGRQFVSIDLAYRIAKKCGLSEALAVECAVRDQIKKSRLKLQVEIKKSA
jgi:transcriptional regulator with XRE-family HTH domain